MKPDLIADEVDNSGVTLYYSKEKRKHELGVLQLADPNVIMQNKEIGSEGVSKHSFDCPAACSENVMSGNVTVLRESLHMHATGAAAVNDVYDSAGNLVHSGRVQYFDFDQQGHQVVVQEPWTLSPGDRIVTSCFYKNNAPGHHFGESTS